MTSTPSVLIVEGDRGVRESLAMVLDYQGYEVTAADSGATQLPAGRQRVRARCPQPTPLDDASAATFGRMFQPRHFAEDRIEVIVELARVTGFGHLAVAGPDGLASTPMPFLVDDEGTYVRAHLARPNPIWQLAPCDALLIVPVSDAYVSPGWYPSKAEHGKVVPTWNYEVVHLHGRLVAHDDPAWLHRQVRDLTDRHESPMPEPWAVDDAPTEFVDKMVGGIVGVELQVDRVVGKRKLSQNRPDPDRAGVLAALDEHHSDRKVAEAMRETSAD